MTTQRKLKTCAIFKTCVLPGNCQKICGIQGHDNDTKLRKYYTGAMAGTFKKEHMPTISCSQIQNSETMQHYQHLFRS